MKGGRVWSRLVLLSILIVGSMFEQFSPFFVPIVKEVSAQGSSDPQATSAPSIIWNITYGGPYESFGGVMVSTSDGGYAIAGICYEPGACLVKTDSDGRIQWTSTFMGVGPRTRIHSMVQTSDGGYVIAGETGFGGPLPIYEAFLVKITGGGMIEWRRTYGWGAIYSVVQTRDGGYALVWFSDYGAYLVKTDSSGNVQWMRTYKEYYPGSLIHIHSVIQTRDGYALFGMLASTTEAHFYDYFLLVKTDPSGNRIWSRTYEGPNTVCAASIIQTTDEGYALAGTTTESTDPILYAEKTNFFLVKTDSSGNMKWSRTYGGPSMDVVTSMVQTRDGGYALAGFTSSFGAGMLDFWLVKTDSSGQMLWSGAYGGPSYEYGYPVSVAEAGDGAYALAGTTRSYGAQLGIANFWLIKIGRIPDLNLLEVKPVQAINESDTLVDGKQTLLRVVVSSSFPETQRDVQIKLVYDTFQLGTKTTMTTVVHRDVEPGRNSYYLPPERFIIPSGDQFTVYSAEIDANKAIKEANETNNALPGPISFPVVDTKPLRILYVPVKILLDTAPSTEEMIMFEAGSLCFMEATYPISEAEYESSISRVPLLINLKAPLGHFAMERIHSNLNRMTWFTRYNRAVGVVRKDWFKDNTDRTPRVGEAHLHSKAAIIERQCVSGSVTAHEIAHTFGWVSGHPPGDIDNPIHMSNMPAPGHYVYKRREVKYRIDFMHVGAAIADWPFPDRWISNYTWEFLLNALKPRLFGDPPVIGISGIVYRNGTTILDPWYRFEGILDIPLGNPGEFRILYLDQNGIIIGETGFDVSFTIPEGGGESDVSFFSLRIPDLADTNKIVIKRGDQVLAERLISPNPPVVTVTGPNGGEVYEPGETVTVKWDSSDLDGDTLTYVVSLSQDDGTIWIPLAIDLTTNEFSFAPPDIFSISSLIRVTASDGVNTAEDTSDSTFTTTGFPDIALTNMTLSETVVAQGDVTLIDGTVQNQGYHTETFNLTTYANTTEIGKQTVTLESGASTTVSFTWNTNGFAVGKYAIRGYVSPVPDELDTADNEDLKYALVWAFTPLGMTQINEGYISTESYPQIDSGQIVWVGGPVTPMGVPWEIFLYDFPTGTNTRITNNTYLDCHPQIDAGQIVWMGETPDSRHQIFLYDSSTGTTTQITNNTYGNWYPQIDSGQIVWYGLDGEDYEIFLYDISTGTTTQITNNTYLDGDPQVDAGQIVWYGRDGNGDLEIFLYNSTTRETTQITNNTPPYDDSGPQIDAGQIVWWGYDGYDYEIFLYNSTTRETTQITNNNYYDYCPQIDAEQIVWQGRVPSGYEIFLYDSSTGTTTQITNNSYYELWLDPNRVQIDAGRIVWRSTSYPPDQIFLYDISTGTTTQITDSYWRNWDPQIDAGQIVWDQPDTGMIFLYALVSPPPPPPPYDVTIDAHCYTEDTALNVEITMDGTPTGCNTSHTFKGLTDTHTFTVPSTDANGHVFKRWNTGETSTTIIVSSEGTYTAYYTIPPTPYNVTIKAYSYTNDIDVSAAITMDGTPTGYSTPHTFTGLTRTHNFTLPSTDTNQHPFRHWSTGETSTMIIVSSEGTYTAYYRAPPPTPIPLPAPPGAAIWSSDSLGNPKDVFMPAETVYVTVPVTPQGVTLYVVTNKTIWNDGDPLTDVSDRAETLILYRMPYQTIQIWAPPLEAGNYDIVMDLDNDGVFDAGLDLVDSELATGFSVIPEVEGSSIGGAKFYDVNVNEVWDNGEPPIEGWKIHLTGVNIRGDAVDEYAFTDANGRFIFENLLPGSYTVTEVFPTAPTYLNTAPTSFSHDLESGENFVGPDFGNICLKPGAGGHTLGFWANKGQALVTNGDIAALNTLRLYKPPGWKYPPFTSKQEIRTYLLKATAKDMRWMLSAQLIATKLNVLHGFLDGSTNVYVGRSTYVPSGFISINEIMTRADTALSATDRATQEFWKNKLDALNNNKLKFVCPEPCLPLEYP